MVTIGIEACLGTIEDPDVLLPSSNRMVSRSFVEAFAAAHGRQARNSSGRWHASPKIPCSSLVFLPEYPLQELESDMYIYIYWGGNLPMTASVNSLCLRVMSQREPRMLPRWHSGCALPPAPNPPPPGGTGVEHLFPSFFLLVPNNFAIHVPPR